ncbi:MAG: pseudouridine synthase [Bacteroidota bacterium]|nr:pseudouridine synthase [Bacteroidota bacterium]
MYRYFALHKPFNVLSQFTSQEGKKCLKDFFSVPRDVYPVGRLDYDSEGLLVATNDPRVTSELLHPSRGHERAYWVQVEGIITPGALESLRKGVDIQVKGQSFHTLPCEAQLIAPPGEVGERNPPIRYRKSVPDCWIELIIKEGKNRQVRKMTAKVGYPTLRLIRWRIGDLTLSALGQGEMMELSQPELYKLLRINKNQPYATINDRIRKGRTDR